MDNRITIRAPKNKEERLEAASNSTVEDLYHYPCGDVRVTGVLRNGDRIDLGWVCSTRIYYERYTPEDIIDYIRFRDCLGVQI